MCGNSRQIKYLRAHNAIEYFLLNGEFLGFWTDIEKFMKTTMKILFPNTQKSHLQSSHVSGLGLLYESLLFERVRQIAVSIREVGLQLDCPAVRVNGQVNQAENLQFRTKNSNRQISFPVIVGRISSSKLINC